MLATFERSQSARADRIIRRFLYLGARIPGDTQKTADVSNRATAVPYQCSPMVGAPQ
jgi:hypothetical protein